MVEVESQKLAFAIWQRWKHTGLVPQSTDLYSGPLLRLLQKRHELMGGLSGYLGCHNNMRYSSRLGEM